MEWNSDGGSPRLLVSVRSLEEAGEAVAGGCDILDIKEPHHGSLGAAADSTIRNVSAFGRQLRIPVSAALGECADRLESGNSPDSGTVGMSQLNFVKLGLAGMANRQNWSEQWLRHAAECVGPTASGVRHVAVVYADWQAADAPCPQQILDVVTRLIRSGSHNGSPVVPFSGVLIDTFAKSSGRLLDALSAREICSIRQQTAECGLFLGLAGRLTQAMLPDLVCFEPDIVAVRTAACRGQQRNGCVDRTVVSRFRQAMRSPGMHAADTGPADTEPAVHGSSHA